MKEIRKTVLLIEETNTIVRKMKKILKRLKIDIVCKTGVDDALTYIKKNKVELILMNFNSIQNIRNFLQYLRLELKIISMIAIVYSIDTDSYLRCREAFKNGADDYFYLKDYYELSLILKPYIESNNNNNHWMVDKVKDIIKARKSNIRVVEIANELGMDRYKLHEVFQLYENKSIRDFIVEIRMDYLKMYAIQGKTVNEACNEIGISGKCIEKFAKTNFNQDLNGFWKSLNPEEVS